MDKQVPNILPQVGRDSSRATSVPESHSEGPHRSSDRPTDSEGGTSAKPSATPVLQTGTQSTSTGTTKAKTAMEQDILDGIVDRQGNFIKRTSSLTFPICSGNTSDDEVFIIEGRPETPETGKRRRLEYSPPDQLAKKKRTQGFEASMILLRQDLAQMESCFNSKVYRKELKEICMRMQTHIQALDEDHKRQVTELTAKRPMTTEATQTERNAWEKPAITKEEVETTRTYEAFQQANTKTWSERVFKNIKKQVGNPVRATDEAALVVTDPKDPGMQQSIQKIFAEKYPELLQMTQELEYLENTTKILSQGDLKERKTTVIKICPQDTKKDLWGAYEKARDLILESGATTLATHRLANTDEDETRRMLQCIFARTDVQITLYKPNDKPTLAQIVGGRRTTGERPKKSFDTEAIEVVKKGANYADILKDVKSSLGTTTCRKGIKTIRSTKAGSLLIVLEGGSENKDKLEKAIKDNIPSCEVRGRGQHPYERKETFFIRDMDETTTKEEVDTALRTLIGGPGRSGEIEVGDLRPSRNNTLTVTVKIPAKYGDLVLKAGTIQVGLSEGRIEERHSIKRCYRCWSYDHLAKDCKEIDRAANCFKCGKEGHKAADCHEEELRCPLCEKTGHTAGGKGCNAKRKAINRARALSSTTSLTPTTEATRDTSTSK